MGKDKYGISDTLKNYKNLQKIYDILYEKYYIKTTNVEYRYNLYKNVIIYSDDIFEDKEVMELNTKLSKMFYNYSLNNKYMSKKEYDNILEEVREYEKRKKKLEKRESKDRGIYGIYYKGKLIYIGLTLRSFEERFNDHKRNLENKNEDMYLYKFLKDKDYHNNLVLKPLINIKDIKCSNKLNERDIQMMELALITMYQPLCNVKGKYQDYRISSQLVL